MSRQFGVAFLLVDFGRRAGLSLSFSLRRRYSESCTNADVNTVESKREASSVSPSIFFEYICIFPSTSKEVLIFLVAALNDVRAKSVERKLNRVAGHATALLRLLLSLLSPAQALLGSLLSLHQHLWMDPIHYGVAITCI